MTDKGSIALDGISLTLSSVKQKTFTVDIIPLTYTGTTIKEAWKVGQQINIEIDVINKQIHKSVQHILSGKK